MRCPALHTAASGAGVVQKKKKIWRSLTITSFPPEEFIDSHEFLKALPMAFSKPLEGLQSLKIECPGGISLLPIIPFPHNKIINMELSLCSALHHFMQPQFVTTFHVLIRFKVQFYLISTMVDILAQFFFFFALRLCRWLSVEGWASRNKRPSL